MALDFPASPTNGQYYNGFVWNAANQTWDSAYAPRAATIPISSPNYIINGAFDIWQRGTSLTTTANVYTADRWYGEGGNVTVSRQTTGVPPTSTYCMRTAMTSTTFNNKYQIIESVNVAPMRGKTVTYQVKLRRNSSFTGGLTIRLSKSSTVDAGMGATWVEIVGSVVSNASLPTGTAATDWYLASITATIPNDGTANTVRIEVSQTTAEVSGAYWEMAEVQLETESLTPFRRNAPSIQGELATCQRYYQTGGNGASGVMNNVNGARFSVKYYVPMRATPVVKVKSTVYALIPGASESMAASTAIGTTIAAAAGGSITENAASKLDFQGAFTNGVDGKAVTMLTDCLSIDAEL